MTIASNNSSNENSTMGSTSNDHGSPTEAMRQEHSGSLNIILGIFLFLFYSSPIADVLSDIYTLILFGLDGWKWFCLSSTIILLLSFRYATVSSALSASPRFLLKLYIPFLLTPRLLSQILSGSLTTDTSEAHKNGCIKEKSARTSREIPSSARDEDHGSTPTTAAPLEENDEAFECWETESLHFVEYKPSSSLFEDGAREYNIRLKKFIRKEMRKIRMAEKALRSCADSTTSTATAVIWSKLQNIALRIRFEARILAISILVGPFFMAKASFTIAIESYQEAVAIKKPAESEENNDSIVPDEQGAQKQRLRHFNSCVVFMEAVFESVPQFILQFWGALFVFNWDMKAIPIHFYLSFLLSLLDILKGLYTFIVNRNDIMAALKPLRLVEVAGSSNGFVNDVVFVYEDGETLHFGDKRRKDFTEGINLQLGERLVTLEGFQFNNAHHLGTYMKFTTNEGREFLLRGQGFLTTYPDVDFSVPEDQEVHRVKVPLGYYYRLTNDWGILGLDIEMTRNEHGRIIGVY